MPSLVNEVKTNFLTIHFLVSRTLFSGEHRGWAAGLSGVVSSLSALWYDRSDSGARQQQTQELEATRPAVLLLCERVKKRPAWQAHPPRSSLSRSPNSDKVLMRQDVSMACPGMQLQSHPGHSLSLHGLQSLPLTEEKCNLTALKGEKNNGPKIFDWHMKNPRFLC